ncbi:MAG: PQQ-binding-like beta-propeller repeat protein [Planctomycetota bacterium]|nr:PQQ-binding-like beta-propeller repeat protein [Planctomycetota bacterium]
MLGGELAGEQIAVGGSEVSGAEYAGRLKDALGQTASREIRAARLSSGEDRECSGGASPPLAPARWIYRWPIAPVEEIASELDRPSPFRHFPARLIEYEGRIYGHGMHHIFCLDPATGEPLWKDDLPVEGAGFPLGRTGVPICAPCAGEGRIYAKMLAGRTVAIRCYDAARGRLLWSTEESPELKGLVFAGQPAFAYGRVYCSAIRPQGMDTAHFLICLDAASGNPAWKTALGTGEGGFRLGDEYIHMEFNEGPPAVSDGTVYAPTGMAGLVAADAFSGEIRWVSTYQRLRLKDWSLRAAFLRTCPAAGNTPVVTAETVALAPVDHPGIVAFDRKSGRMLWEEPSAWGRALIGSRDDVVVYTTDCAVAVDARTGRKLWRFVPPEGEICGTGAIGGDYVYLPTPSGVLRLSVASGELVDSAPWDGRAGICGNLLLLRDRFLASAPGLAVCFGGAEGRPSAHTAVAAALALEQKGEFAAAAGMYRDGAAAGGSAEIRAMCAVGEVRMLAAAGRLEEAAARLRGIENSLPAAISEAGRWEASRDSVLDSLRAALGLAGRRNVPPPASRFSAAPLYAWQAGDGPAERIAWWPADGPAEAIYALAGSWLYAVEPSQEGRILWKSFAGPGATGIQVSERFVAVLAPRSLRFFDRLSGLAVWTWEIPPDASGMNPSSGWEDVLYWMDIGEKVVMLRSRFHVRALDVASGKPLWSERYDEYQSPVYAMLSRQDAAIAVHAASRHNPELIWSCYEASSGRLADRKSLVLRGHVSAASVLRGSNRLALVCGGTLALFDALKGERIWETPVIQKEGAGWWDARLDPAGDILISSGSEGHRNGPFALEAFRAADGKPVFRHRGWAIPAGGNHFLTFQEGSVSLMEAAPGGSAKATWTVRDDRFRREHFVWAGQSGGALPVLAVRDDSLVLRVFSSSDGSILYERELTGSAIRGEHARPIVPVFFRGDLLAYGAREGMLAIYCGTSGGVSPDERARRIAADTKAPPKAILEARRALTDLAPPGHMAFLAEEIPRMDVVPGESAFVEPIVLNSSADYVPAGPGRVWGGPEDISARVAVSWDVKKIYLAVLVKDDVLVPPAPGADHASGDSLRIVLSSVPASRPGGERAEVFDFSVALREGGVSIHKRLGGGRLKVEARAARDEDARAILYEIAVPWESVRENPHHRPGEHRDMGLGICIYDNDGDAPKGLMEWGAGVSSRPMNPARLGVISFLDLSPRRVSRYRKVIDLIPDDPVAWKFLQTIALKYRGPDATRGRINEYEGFVRAHPASDNVSKALWELKRLYSIEKKDSDPEERVMRLAREAGVSREEMDDFAGKEFRFRLFLDPAAPPSMFMVQFCIEGEGWNRRVYWGESRVDWGRHGTVERLPMGKLPATGKWVDIRIRVSELDMERCDVRGVAFTASGGRFWVDRVAWTVGGEEKVLIEDALPEKSAVEGSAFSLADSPVASGRKSLACDAGRQLFNGHIVGKEGPLFSFRGRPRPEDPATAEKLTARLREVVDEIPDTREGFQFLLKVLDGVSRGKDEKGQRRLVLAELEGFVRKNPDSPNVPAVLDMLVDRYREDGAALPVQKVEAFMTECRVPVGGRLAFFRRHAPPFTRWYVIGPFKARGDRSGMDAQYIPEDRTGFNMGETFTRDGREYAWRIYLPPRGRQDGYVDLKSFFGEEAAESVCAYAYAKFECGSAKRALLLYGARDIISVYVNGKKVVDATESRPDKDAQSTEVRLKKGENDVLIKVGGRSERIGFFFRIAETDGRPVGDLTVKFPPP